MNVTDLTATLTERLSQWASSVTCERGDVAVEVPRAQLLTVCEHLRDEPVLGFSILIDVCGVDYGAYGTQGDAHGESAMNANVGAAGEKRFAVVYHLLSVTNNHRVRLKCFVDSEFPSIDSVVSVWSSADWFERETFDLFGIMFEGHPDLRRLLTDYGFIGHPFRKDFPLAGHVEMRYDPERGRVVYEPVSIDPRVLVPRTNREEGFGG